MPRVTHTPEGKILPARIDMQLKNKVHWSILLNAIGQ